MREKDGGFQGGTERERRRKPFANEIKLFLLIFWCLLSLQLLQTEEHNLQSCPKKEKKEKENMK